MEVLALPRNHLPVSVNPLDPKERSTHSPVPSTTFSSFLPLYNLLPYIPDHDHHNHCFLLNTYKNHESLYVLYQTNLLTLSDNINCLTDLPLLLPKYTRISLSKNTHIIFNTICNCTNTVRDSRNFR